MNWTTELPTAEGWYWAIDNANGDERFMVHVVLEDGELFAITDDDSANDLDMFIHWLGPLPVPEPPVAYTMPRELERHLMA